MRPSPVENLRVSTVPGAFFAAKKKNWDDRRKQTMIRQDLDTLPDIMLDIDKARKAMVQFEGCLNRRPVAEEFYASLLGRVQTMLRNGMKKDMLEAFMIMLIRKYIKMLRKLVGIIDGTPLLEKYQKDERVVGCRALCVTALAMKMNNEEDEESSVSSRMTGRFRSRAVGSSLRMLQDVPTRGSSYPMLQDAPKYPMLQDAPKSGGTFIPAGIDEENQSEGAISAEESEPEPAGVKRFGRWYVYVDPGNVRNVKKCEPDTILGLCQKGNTSSSKKLASKGTAASEVLTKSAAPGSVSILDDLSETLSIDSFTRNSGFKLAREVAMYSKELSDLARNPTSLSEFSCVSEVDADRVLPLEPQTSEDLEFLPLLKASVPQVDVPHGARYTVQLRRAHPGQKFGVTFHQDHFGVFVSEDCPLLEMQQGDRLLQINGLKPKPHVERCLERARSLLLILRRGTGFYNGDNPQLSGNPESEAVDCGCCDQNLNAGAIPPGPWFTLLSVTRPVIMSAQRGEFEICVQRLSTYQSFGLSFDVNETAKSRSVILSAPAPQFGCLEGDTLVHVNGARAKGGNVVMGVLQESIEVCLRLARQPALSLMDLRFAVEVIGGDYFEAGNGIDEFTYDRPTRSNLFCCR